MRRTRWQHLDREKPPPTPPDEITLPGATEGVPAASPPEPAWLAAAKAQYRLGAYEECLMALTRREELGETAPGAVRLRGLALVHLGVSSSAVRTLRDALAEAPDDDALRACLWSVELDLGIVPAAAERSAPVLHDLVPACDWLRGQQLAGSKRYAQAAQAFRAATAGFAAHSPPSVLVERLAAAYVGQGISYLLAGQPEARACYSRLPRTIREEGGAPPLVRFAQELYTVGEALRELPFAERANAVAPLAEVLSGVRMRVRFLEPDSPTETNIRWDLNYPV